MINASGFWKRENILESLRMVGRTANLQGLLIRFRRRAGASAIKVYRRIVAEAPEGS